MRKVKIEIYFISYACTNKMRIYIKKLTVEHYYSIKDIFTQQFNHKDITTKDLYYSWKNRSRDLSIGIFTKEGDLIGFALVDYNYISFIALHSSFQKMNLGSTLIMNILKKCIRDNRSIYLYPLEQRQKLINWYGSHGFYKTSNGFLGFHCYHTRRQSPFIKKLLT
jgi:ribosomal protein S18 acetylase RimI-like enzyme